MDGIGNNSNQSRYVDSNISVATTSIQVMEHKWMIHKPIFNVAKAIRAPKSLLKAEKNSANISNITNITSTTNITNTTNALLSTNIDEVVHSVVCLMVLVPLLSLILREKKLRSKQPNKLFANLLVVHILFNISVIVSNFVQYSHIQFSLQFGFVVTMFFALLVLSLERFMVIKFPFGTLKINT